MKWNDKSKINFEFLVRERKKIQKRNEIQNASLLMLTHLSHYRNALTENMKELVKSFFFFFFFLAGIKINTEIHSLWKHKALNIVLFIDL